MLFLFRSAPEVKKRIHSKLFRKFWEEPGYKRANLHYCRFCFCPTHRGSIQTLADFWATFWSLSINTQTIRGEPFSMCSQCEDWCHLIGRFFGAGIRAVRGRISPLHNWNKAQFRRVHPPIFLLRPACPLLGPLDGRPGSTAGRNPLITLLSITPSVPQGSVCTWN